MNQTKIHLCLAHMSESGMEQKYVQEAFDTNWVVPLGPNVTAFEHDLEDWLENNGAHAKYVTALSSGTAAIHLALLACGVERGDEVICQSFTFCASANPIVYIGANPIFVDSEVESWNMDPSLLREAIEERIRQTGKKPKAIVAVHLYGMPAKMDAIVEVAKEYQIPLVEDAAEALGSSYQGKPCGAWGDFGVYSFNGNKMITTSGGGAVVCPNEEMKQKTLYWATQARESVPYYQHNQIGYNYRLSNICAGIGRGQMTVLPDHIEHHRRIADLYKQAFINIEGIEYHDNPSDAYESNFWLSTILLKKDLTIKGMEQRQKEGEPNCNVEALRRWLEQCNVESRTLWKPMHLQPVFAEAKHYVNGVSDELFSRGLCLPSGPWVTEEDVHMIVKSIVDSIK
ncbi:MAG: DegT/DnrJ/EryC1/StrS family aminotransferase [Paludibacteraceae bacterium]|nr:DegT/DnrJ/EryC1/StrS family aminotransferase [Paludibacteraceae bacterium]